MVAYCALLALQDYATSLGQGYEVTVGEETLLIEIDGKIVLTDAPRYREHQNRHSLRRICSDQGKTTGRIAMGQLGAVLLRMVEEDATNQSYSENLTNFIELLKNSRFQSIGQALTHLEFIKKSERFSSTKPKSQASLN